MNTWGIRQTALTGDVRYVITKNGRDTNLVYRTEAEARKRATKLRDDERPIPKIARDLPFNPEHMGR